MMNDLASEKPSPKIIKKKNEWATTEHGCSCTYRSKKASTPTPTLPTLYAQHCKADEQALWCDCHKMLKASAIDEMQCSRGQRHDATHEHRSRPLAERGVLTKYTCSNTEGRQFGTGRAGCNCRLVQDSQKEKQPQEL